MEIWPKLVGWQQIDSKILEKNQCAEKATLTMDMEQEQRVNFGTAIRS